MKFRPIIIVTIVFTALTFCLPVFAVHLVPQLSPLQPIPTNTAPNVSKNINTPGNTYNQTQQQAQQEIVPVPTNTSDQSLSPQAEPTETEVASSNPESGALYWFLLISGIVGLLLVGVWYYFRFYRKGRI